jgi:hypothetical protein
MMAQVGYVAEGIGGDLIAYVRHHANGDADVITLRDGEDRLPRRGTDASWFARRLPMGASPSATGSETSR